MQLSLQLIGDGGGLFLQYQIVQIAEHIVLVRITAAKMVLQKRENAILS